MKITKNQIKKIIKEEKSRLLSEVAIGGVGPGFHGFRANRTPNFAKPYGAGARYANTETDETTNDKASTLKETSKMKITKRQLLQIIREERQGYDDREDERLGMEHGADDHDEQDYHDRRDDAGFEERAPEVHVHLHSENKRISKNRIRRIVREHTRRNR